MVLIILDAVVICISSIRPMAVQVLKSQLFVAAAIDGEKKTLEGWALVAM